MKEVYEKARQLMKGFCRLCPVCDGRACAGEVPGMGGIGTGSTFQDNVLALSEIKLNMRCLHDVYKPNLDLNLLGFNLSMPVMAAPIGGVPFNMGGGISEEEYIRSKLEACVQKNTLGCTGDGVPDFVHESGLAAIQSVQGQGIPFIKPWQDKELFAKLDKAITAGAHVVGMDIDAAGLITLSKMGHPVWPKSAAKLSEIIQRTPAKFVIKGIMTPDEAKLCLDAGAAGIVVSNHGGRVLDGQPGTARVLPDVVKAVHEQIAVLVDGGIRSGTDVLRMLALGADAVFIGRPLSMAVLGGGQTGAASYLDSIRQELIQSMILTGTASVQDVDPSIIYTQNHT